MKQKVTKTDMVLNHLIEHGNITTWEAIQKYNATRLSAIVFNLKKRGHDIAVDTIQKKDKFGNNCHFAKYILQKAMKQKAKQKSLFN